MAGVAGFEPTNDGVRVRCLTAWRHPNFKMLIYFSRYSFFLQAFFTVFLNFCMFFQFAFFSIRKGGAKCALFWNTGGLRYEKSFGA